ncbi:hypothetical protein BC833DRAFT_602818 [Globomyces pollinis-pini]|nr:hypothetical protein BC833DRAFT_602818 [Globomyces pollinis-pini]
MTRAKLIQLTQLVIISLLWQGLQYWSYFLNGHPYTRWTFTLLGLILPFLTVIFQTEILLIFTLIPVHKDRIKIFQKVFTFLYVICFIIMLLRAYYYVTITPAWLMMIYYGTYLPFVIISFLYENFHAFKVSTSLFYVAKSFAEVSNLNPEIWKSQYRTYKQLFLLIAVNLFLQWIAVGFWVIGFTSDESLVFPNLMIIGLTGGSSHIIFGNLTILFNLFIQSFYSITK